MPYRIEQNLSWKAMWNNLHTFLTELTNIYDVNYESAQGNGVFSNLSVPAATSTTETWTLVCTNATYPQTFSVQGNITGNTANAVVDTLYDNGIVSFTLVDGAAPWGINDIISFSTESTITPVWGSMGPDGKPEQQIKRFYHKYTGLNAQMRGDFVYLEDGPKPDSISYVAKEKGSAQVEVLPDSYCIVGEELDTDWEVGTSWPTLPQWSVTFYTRKPSEAIVGEFRHPTSGTLVVSVSPYENGLYGGMYLETGGAYLRFGTINGSALDLYTMNWNTEQYYLDNATSADTWVLHTITIDGDSVEAFINTTSLGTQTDTWVESIGTEIWAILGNADVADLVIWNRKLTTVDIADIISSPSAVDPNGVDIYDAYIVDTNDILPKIAVSNFDNEGNSISAVFSPQNNPYFSYNLSTSFRGTHYSKDTTQDMMNWSYEVADTNRRTPSEMPCESYAYLLGGEPTHIVEKYWFIADNNFIIVAFKTYDPSTQQQLPVYQVGYIGNPKTINEQQYKVAAGTYSSGADYWYTASTAFRSGIYYATNAIWLSQMLYDRPSHINYSSIASGMLDASNSYNVFPIIHRKNVHLYTTFTWDNISPSSERTTWHQFFGEFRNIQGVQVTNVTHEDILIIDGIRHIVLGDTTRAGENSLILVKLD